MKLLKIIFLFSICFFLFGCPGDTNEHDIKYDIVNSSQEDISMFLKYSNSPITTEQFAIPSSIIVLKDGVFNGASYYDNFSNGKKLWILIFKQSTLDNYTWEEIRENNLYDKRYELVVEDIKQLNYQIIYTGN